MREQRARQFKMEEAISLLAVFVFEPLLSDYKLLLKRGILQTVVRQKLMVKILFGKKHIVMLIANKLTVFFPALQ